MTEGAVDAFSSKAQVCLGYSLTVIYPFSYLLCHATGSELAVSVGPLGRSAGTDFHAGEKGATPPPLSSP